MACKAMATSMVVVHSGVSVTRTSANSPTCTTPDCGSKCTVNFGDDTGANQNATVLSLDNPNRSSIVESTSGSNVAADAKSKSKSDLDNANGNSGNWPCLIKTELGNERNVYSTVLGVAGSSERTPLAGSISSSNAGPTLPLDRCCSGDFCPRRRASATGFTAVRHHQHAASVNNNVSNNKNRMTPIVTPNCNGVGSLFVVAVGVASAARTG
mmetsp:Transcript_16985/g.29417  ORF Transcript_16985/g.29417 Transcript_16985/m.29417 type:complete len:212 (+) Transcript_16985:348-983(+)